MKNFTVIAATLLIAGSASAQDAGLEAGKNEYIQACASCHGESALGTGPIAQLLNVEVPKLTTLAKDNDGAFPMLEVIHVIDGRSGVRGHGGMMPVWGDRFKAAMVGASGEYGAELMVRGRVLAIAQYLESVQE